MRFLFVTKEVFFILAFGLSIIYVSLNLQGCTKNQMPAVDVSFWAGDSEAVGIVRAQENKVIACAQAEFDQYACLTYADIKKLYAAMLQCKEWGPPIATQNQLLVLQDKNTEVIHNVLKTR